jgi:hypothetical protein
VLHTFSLRLSVQEIPDLRSIFTLFTSLEASFQVVDIGEYVLSAWTEHRAPNHQVAMVPEDYRRLFRPANAEPGSSILRISPHPKFCHFRILPHLDCLREVQAGLGWSILEQVLPLQSVATNQLPAFFNL